MVNLTKLLSNAAINIGEIQNLIQAVSEEVDLRQLRPNDLIELLYAFILKTLPCVFS